MVQYVCNEPGCGKSYEIYASWYTHTQLKHRDPRVACKTCGRLFHTASSLYRHAYKDQCQPVTPKPPSPPREALTTNIKRPSTLASTYVDFT